MTNLQVVAENPFGAIIIVALMVLLGWGGRGFYLNWRKDKRDSATDGAELFDTVRTIVRREMLDIAERAEADRDYFAEQLAAERKDNRLLRLRADQLVHELRAHGLPVPDWPVVDSKEFSVEEIKKETKR